MSAHKEISVSKKNDVVSSVSISDTQKKNAVLKAALKTAFDTIPDLLKGLVPGLKIVVSSVKNFNDAVNEEKLKNLLISFRNRYEDIETTQRRLEYIVGSPGGVLLFHKVVQIVNAGPLDEEWIKLLAAVLEKVSDENIEEQFEERNYVLAQISNLSSHALILLSKNQSWYKVHFTGSTTMSGQTIVGDWDRQVSRFFAGNVGIDDDDAKMRIAHAFKELERSGMVYITKEKTLDFTQIGARIKTYIE